MRRFTPILALTLVVAACSASGDGHLATDAPEATTVAVSADDLGGNSACRSSTSRVDETMSVSVVGVQRDYDVFVPEGLEGRLPVILAYHGFSQSAIRQRATGLGDFAEQLGFIAVFPHGTNPDDGPSYFNIETTDQPGLADDIAFTESMLDALEAQFCVDTSRIFAMGFSNGGMFVAAVACRLGDRIAAIAPVAGIVMLDECGERPVPIIATHGTDDETVPFDTADPESIRDTARLFGANDLQEEMFGAIDRSVTTYVDMWAKHNSCTSEPIVDEVDARLTILRYDGCVDGADVVLQIVGGGGHDWPKPILDNPLDATAAALSFFESHPLPATG